MEEKKTRKGCAPRLSKAQLSWLWPPKVRWQNLLALTLAGAINAFGVTIFLYPVDLYDSGISGTAMLLDKVTALPMAAFLLLLNLPIFAFGWRRQGPTFTLYSTYAVAIYALGASLITNVLPVDVSAASPLAGTDLLLCAVFGGLISGVGSGLTIRFGGAIDGVEVLAVIFAKRIGLTVGSFVMIYNVALYVVCGIVFQSWTLPLYSILTYAAALKTVDFVVEGIDRSKAATIITTRPEHVCDALSRHFGVGVTWMEAKGGFSHTRKAMVYFVVNRFQIGQMKSVVHDQDPSAYISITEVADVFKKNQ